MDQKSLNFANQTNGLAVQLSMAEQVFRTQNPKEFLELSSNQVRMAELYAQERREELKKMQTEIGHMVKKSPIVVQTSVTVESMSTSPKLQTVGKLTLGQIFQLIIWSNLGIKNHIFFCSVTLSLNQKLTNFLFKLTVFSLELIYFETFFCLKNP